MTDGGRNSDRDRDRDRDSGGNGELKFTNLNG